jgi:hypothetical protein
MTKIIVKIEGLDDFAAGVKRAPQETVKQLSLAVQKSLLNIQNQAIKEAPANKQVSLGARLKASFRSRMMTKLSGQVYSISPYSAAVHEGTRPHIIRVVNKRILANKRTGQFFGKIVNHPGTQPNPYFLRAIERASKKIEENFDKALENVLKML